MDLQTVADRVEIEALRGEFTDAAMMRNRPRLAALFTEDGVLRMPNVPVEFTGREAILAGGEKLQAQWDFFVQNTHPGSIQLAGDSATGRTYMHEVVRTLTGHEGINFAIYHDRYQRTADGWRFAERVYEVRYLDPSPLAGGAPEAKPSEPGFAVAATDAALDRTVAALTANGFTAEIVDDLPAARTRVAELIPAGASVFTSASETLRLSGIDDDINRGDAYDPVKPRLYAIDRATGADEIRRLMSIPDVVVGSVAAVTETGSLVVASATGSQLPAYAGGAAKAIWIVGAQKVVPDLSTALRRVEEHALPLEDARAKLVYGKSSAINRLLVLNAENPGRGTVVLVREAVGF
ncbi:MAG: LUD domain-containing protein [Hamadaea sp.]|uniref:nuclear transport factor 2 family protein n=1 Tax=Hamadaea sp. TaxID=2024425 RepID=UPI001857E0A1|nr:LUD domain-containing protein [Hamadaea sp.]NUR72201.1 LUD domain-containing protein [Hamadaea sp.]NUT18618.1 LUD domain-containing protein [Hamadaea sp.]